MRVVMDKQAGKSPARLRREKERAEREEEERRQEQERIRQHEEQAGSHEEADGSHSHPKVELKPMVSKSILHSKVSSHQLTPFLISIRQ